MSINLIALLMLLAMQIMMTVILNSLWRLLKKAGYLLKALILQIPLMQRVDLQIQELEETAAQRKTARRESPEQRKPTLDMDQEEAPAKQKQNRNRRQSQNRNHNQKQNPDQDQN